MTETINEEGEVTHIDGVEIKKLPKIGKAMNIGNFHNRTMNLNEFVHNSPEDFTIGKGTLIKKKSDIRGDGLDTHIRNCKRIIYFKWASKKEKSFAEETLKGLTIEDAWIGYSTVRVLKSIVRNLSRAYKEF